VDGEYPRTAILVHRHHDRITLTDQYGATFAYPAAAVIPTAVPDALPLRDRTRAVHLSTRGTAVNVGSTPKRRASEVSGKPSRQRALPEPELAPHP